MSNNNNDRKEKSFGRKAAESAALGAIGATAGAITLGMIGALLGGPPGAIIGAKIGAFLGGSGAVVSS